MHLSACETGTRRASSSASRGHVEPRRGANRAGERVLSAHPGSVHAGSAEEEETTDDRVPRDGIHCLHTA